jgi:ATP-dependent RNA helicase RhlE
MPPELNRVASEALMHPQRVDLAPPSRPAAGITQAVYPVPRHLKTDLLDEMLVRTDVGSVLVFTRTKHGADRLTRQLQQRGHSVAALHGDRTQSQRERALESLRRGRVQILVATDIASRGIDVDDISHVINYDVPHSPEDYVHRIGRTGRVQAEGDAFTLMSPEEKKEMAAIERFLGRSILRVVVPDFDYKRHGDSSRTSRRADHETDARSRDGGRGGRRGRSRGLPGSTTTRGHGEGKGSRPAGQSRTEATRPAAGAHEETAHGRRPQRNAPDRRRRRM